MFRKILAVALGAIIFLPVAANARTRHVVIFATIAANRPWQKVRLRLARPGVLHFHASGQWVFNPSQPAVGGDGAANLSTAGRTSYTFSGPAGREGQLIGRIGRRRPFIAGTRGRHVVKPREVGPLYLMINDDIAQAAGAGLADNSGHLRVRIDFERRRLRGKRRRHG